MSKNLITVHASMTGIQPVTHTEIDRRDRKAGYSKCGYHFIIERTGELYRKRFYEEPSIHDELPNAPRAISICLIGGPDNNFALVQRSALADLILNIQRSITNHGEVLSVVPGLSIKELLDA